MLQSMGSQRVKHNLATEQQFGCTGSWLWHLNPYLLHVGSSFQTRDQSALGAWSLSQWNTNEVLENH